MSKQLFRGVVEALQQGGMNKSEISDFTGHSVSFVEREIERIKQCGPFKEWIRQDSSSQVVEFTLPIKRCPLDSIVYMIKHFYRKEKYNMDMKMDLQNKAQKIHTTSEDYDLIDKFVGLVDTYDEFEDYQDVGYIPAKNYFDFSSIEI